MATKKPTSEMTIAGLREVAARKGIALTSKMNKAEIIAAIEGGKKSKGTKAIGPSKDVAVVAEKKPTSVRRGGEY